MSSPTAQSLKPAAFLLVFAVCTVAAAQAPVAVTIDAAMVRLIDQVEIPARDNGLLKELLVREGRLVQEGDLLGRLDDRQPRIALQRAEQELKLATRKATNDVAIRGAVKAQEVAQTELKRAADAKKAFNQSVSQAEIDALQLKAEKATLDIEQAREDQELARITMGVKQTEVEDAKAVLEQRMVVAPWSGMVVQVHSRVGDWLQTGDKVARLVRLDRLRIEAFLQPSDLAQVQVDSPVQFAVTLGKQVVDFDGSVVFVSPEVDPVNGQIRIWAEIDNPNLSLRPGQRGKLTIGPAAVKAARAKAE
jgi:multidrug efflux pump subunit AcrA (membrane-fusion protein)